MVALFITSFPTSKPIDSQRYFCISCLLNSYLLSKGFIYFKKSITIPNNILLRLSFS